MTVELAELEHPAVEAPVHEDERSNRGRWVALGAVLAVWVVGGVLLKARPDAGPPALYDATVEPGALELSNEDATSGMAAEVSNSREFEMTMRVVEAFRDIERSAANKIMNK